MMNIMLIDLDVNGGVLIKKRLQDRVIFICKLSLRFRQNEIFSVQESNILSRKLCSIKLISKKENKKLS